MKKLLKITLTLLITIVMSIGIFIPELLLGTPAGFAVGNWYQQFVPNLNGRQIINIYFTDSLKGYAITNKLGDTSLVLKTTNRGDNWVINRADSGHNFTRIQFINQSTGFVGGLINTGSLYYILKTTNAGSTWTFINTPMFTYQADMSVLNEDTIWFVMDESLTGGVFRTTNGGANWTVNNTYKPDKIYMYNRNIGFSSRLNSVLYKTTDSGLNWIQIVGANGFLDIKFTDSLIGWKGTNINGTPYFDKTTNGGLNWFNQVLPTGGMISTVQVQSISILNNDTVYAAGGTLFYSSGQFRGIIFRTTNGGNTWLFQIPDTSIHISYYSKIQFINRRIGWAYTIDGGIHTTNGGDTNWLSGVIQTSTEVPKDYKLYQNYPNPFNPVTNIRYDIKHQTSNVRLIVYDLQGKLAAELVNQKQNTGTYEADWNASSFSSGVYFYSLIINGKPADTRKMILLK